ncbi:MAG: patatin-like phospholipase family protein [Pseudomonadota bacterium]|nr:patatin-like phospholipase family protein [Pseudomonadota bacterium]
MDPQNAPPIVTLSSRALESPLAGLTAQELRRLALAAERRTLSRGEILLRRGDPSESVHFLATGRLAVVTDEGVTVNEIAPGEPVGEIGFFARIPRTFTVRAIRDSEVLTLEREKFDAASAEMPALRDSVIRALAVRLAQMPARTQPSASPRTVAVVAAGGAKLSQRFLARLRASLSARSRIKFLGRGDVAAKLGGGADRTNWLNALEAAAAMVIYVADDELSDWTRTCIRQADLLLLVGAANGSREIGPIERFAFSIHAPAARRLVLLHDKRRLIVSGTADWLAGRDLFMHHHVSLEDGADVDRLARFLTGRATGFVAGGGGALGAAHLGVYQAFCEAGAQFDMFGGSSVGAAMAAAMAMGVPVAEAVSGTHRIFVTRRAFRRFNFPYHGLINHKAFDESLRREFGDTRIEDLWRPFFALSSDVTERAPSLHRDGPVWRAVRASSSIPGALPPCFSVAGHLLVDGALFENVPLAAMKSLKSGPNLVVALSGENSAPWTVDYDRIPGPRDWLLRALTPWRRPRDDAPNLVQVIMLAMLANRRRPLEIGDEDWLIHPAIPADVHWLQWRRHQEVYEASYRGAQAMIAAGEPRFAAIFTPDRVI